VWFLSALNFKPKIPIQQDQIALLAAMNSFNIENRDLAL